MINIAKIVEILKNADTPQSDFVQYTEKHKNPFIVLISCILSLRTKDETTYPATLRMLKLGSTPEDFLHVSQEELEKAIYPVGFYKNKAKQILEISKTLVKKHNSQVPKTIEELIKFKGVGRKTANLTLAKGYGIPAICVDVHVHRICNRLGYLKTKEPDETELVLRNILPKQFWLDFNTILVTHGQQICRPIGPKCDICPISEFCNKLI
ncbi:MAG: endonuclease III [Candidatus Gastranaerophilales bacterium]|nr:endonuclease III [Candidatus Gastranaerophilales bacterium]